jgi:WD40 repeat protein
VYSIGFHPTADKPLVFAGDKLGNLGLFDASQRRDDTEAGDEEPPEPAISAFKVHTRTISSFLFTEDPNSVYSGSYDSSVRRTDLQKGTAVEVYAPKDLDADEPISTIAVPDQDPNLLYFSTLTGGFGRHDMREPAHTADIWSLSDKKIGGFSLHPLVPHLVATGSIDRTLKIWDLRRAESESKGGGKGSDVAAPTLLGEHTSRLSVSHAAWSAAGHVATSGYDDTIKVYTFGRAAAWTPGRALTADELEPTAVVRHNNQTGRWVTVLKPQWQARPGDGFAKFVIANMNRFVDVYTARGEQLAQLGGEGITAVPAVAHFHPTRDWVAGGTGSGKLCLWM